MPALERTFRRELENAVKNARRVAEAGARQSLEQLAIHHHEPWGPLTAEQRKLRNRLRAHGRQLGDKLDEHKGTQTIMRLVSECAYEHWHRLFFARFLAENNLLVEPQSGMPLSLDECKELARERGGDWLLIAGDFAQSMLPQIFRADDPVLDVSLPPETRQELEGILEALARDVFLADDSLGWVYQFWQAEKKEQVNESGNKIGADELPAVTQLFTEDYMVLFLLHNTLGAWWAGKKLATHPQIAIEAKDEAELRSAVALPGVGWEYLRFVRTDDGKGSWRPAAGTFDGWPKTAKELRLLDPCMGSGHFLVAELPILTEMRVAEEDLSMRDACDAVLRENLFGLEIDARCSQIAAFALAITAWKMGGYRTLPSLNLACSGLCIGTKKSEWLSLAGSDQGLRWCIEQLYDLFRQAPVLGSLIDPSSAMEIGDISFMKFHEIQPLIQQVFEKEQAEGDDAGTEIAVAAKGIAHAAEILSQKFTLVATNVPYLGRGKQCEILTDYCERVHPEAAADLATCFVARCLEFCSPGSSTALVTPQNWLFLGTYKKLRQCLLTHSKWEVVTRLGEHAFESSQAAGAFVALVELTRRIPPKGVSFYGMDASSASLPKDKAAVLLNGHGNVFGQEDQLEQPDCRIVFGDLNSGVSQLSAYAECYQGVRTGDRERFIVSFWEVTDFQYYWMPFRNSSDCTDSYSGLCEAICWEEGKGQLHEYAAKTRDKLHDMHESGNRSWGRLGIAINQMRKLAAYHYLGERYDGNVNVIVPSKSVHLVPIWSFCSSSEYELAVRCLDQKLNVTNATLIKVPFDLAHWQKVASEKYPNGLPKPHSDDPTQWLFNGHPKGSEQQLQVAVARLLGYRWPRQTGSSFPDCPALGKDGLEQYTDEDGIVCLTPLRGEASASDRLRALLSHAYGSEWSPLKQSELLTAVSFEGKSLDDWLRDGFFEQHCALFHQRPFVWHIWDGLKNGFSALVNYHKLAGPKGESRRTLEKLIYAYLGDWIDRQRADQSAGVDGSDARVAVAEHLRSELEKILSGEPPYDLFVRWKPLQEQPIGWEPDINDGVRINIRPFMMARPLNAKKGSACILRITPKIKWDKDRGKEPERAKEEFPWFWGWDESTKDFQGGGKFDGNRWNDLHYSSRIKHAARERAKAGG